MVHPVNTSKQHHIFLSCVNAFLSSEDSYTLLMPSLLRNLATPSPLMLNVMLAKMIVVGGKYIKV